MRQPYNQEPWWHPSTWLGLVFGYACVLLLLTGMIAYKLGRIALGRN